MLRRFRFDVLVFVIGDQVQFQNGFGAWQRMCYNCTYDPLNERVKSVDVSERR